MEYKTDKGRKYYHHLGTLYPIWGFNGGAFARRQFPLEKLVYLQKARAGPDGKDV